MKTLLLSLLFVSGTLAASKDASKPNATAMVRNEKAQKGERVYLLPIPCGLGYCCGGDGDVIVFTESQYKSCQCCVGAAYAACLVAAGCYAAAHAAKCKDA